MCPDTIRSLTLDLAERLKYLDELGCEGLAATGEEPTARTLERIREELGDCQRCPLSRNRRKIVFGTGNPWARLMLVGEGPGAEEDRQGLPFVGPAGKLLTDMLKAISLSRRDVYIANIVKCRPPQNRDPQPEEIQTCIPFLEAQIRAIRPAVIMTLGRISSESLGATSAPIKRLRGSPMSFEGITVIPTYHPAYLLRYPVSKREAWSDLKLVRQILDEAEARSGVETG